MKVPQRVELSETVESERPCFSRKLRVTEPRSPKLVWVPELSLPVFVEQPLAPASPVAGPLPGPWLPPILMEPRAPEFQFLECWLWQSQFLEPESWAVESLAAQFLELEFSEARFWELQLLAVRLLAPEPSEPEFLELPFSAVRFSARESSRVPRRRAESERPGRCCLLRSQPKPGFGESRYRAKSIRLALSKPVPAPA